MWTVNPCKITVHAKKKKKKAKRGIENARISTIQTRTKNQ